MTSVIKPRKAQEMAAPRKCIPILTFGIFSFLMLLVIAGHNESYAGTKGYQSSLAAERDLRDALLENPPFLRSDQEPPAHPAPVPIPAYAPGPGTPNTGGSSQGDLLSCYREGVRLFNEKKWYLAIAQFNRAIEIEPRFAKAYAVRALAYAAVGDFDRAVNDSTIAIEINPRLPFAYETRAIGHYARNRYNDAWNDVRKAQSMGHTVNVKFLSNLRDVSGRRN